ncbi:MAG: lysylphosphatidylglycerol synthase transmembrane domain-containing protein [bacterium]
MNSRGVRIGISIAISALFLGFAVRGVHWDEAGAALAEANYWWVAAMVPVTIWSLYVRAQRWRVFLHGVGIPPMRPLVSATNIGFLGNMVLPLRIGEVIRPVLLSRLATLPLSGVLASVLIERIFDMFTILLLFGMSAALVNVSDQVRHWGWLLSGLAAAVAAVIVLIRVQEQLALRIARWMADRLPSKFGTAAYGFAEGFVRALDTLDSPAAYVRAFAWSIYLWIVISLVYAFGFWAFHFDVPALRGALVLTTLVAIAVSVPSAPGFIGSFQLGCVLALRIFGIDESQALAYSLVVHATQFIGCIAAGLYSLGKEGISLRDAEAVESSDAAPL